VPASSSGLWGNGLHVPSDKSVTRPGAAGLRPVMEDGPAARRKECASALTQEKKQQTDSLFNLLKNKKIPYLKKWNGGFSLEQLSWINKELELAIKNNQKVGFYCHFPIFPIDQHNIWNRNQFLALINPYKNVKIFFNGHNHAGGYQMKNNVHYLTFKGMVDTENTSAFAKVQFDKDTITIEGYHREPSRKLVIK